VHFMVGPISLTLPLYQGKRLRILGMTSPERLAVAPDVPTLSEQGLAIVNYGWWGVCARGGTPRPVIERLNRDVVAAIGTSDYRTAMERGGVLPVSSTPDEMGREIGATVQEYGRMIRELGIQQVD
jgi:tripartite-type tricarboxylate transporter receptor subunit TctC